MHSEVAQVGDERVITARETCEGVVEAPAGPAFDTTSAAVV